MVDTNPSASCWALANWHQWRPAIRRTRSCRSSGDHRVSDRAIGETSCNAPQRPVAADVHRNVGSRLGRDRHQGHSRREADRSDQGQGPDGPGAARRSPHRAAPTPPAPPAGKAPAADAPKPETRIVVVGDSDFAPTTTLGFGQSRHVPEHRQLACQQENLISIRPKDPEDRRLTMSAAAQRNITWLSWLGIPAIVFGLGIVSWARRRG